MIDLSAYAALVPAAARATTRPTTPAGDPGDGIDADRRARAVTTSDARRYQNLRAHLGYLKLNDDADALTRSSTPPATTGSR